MPDRQYSSLFTGDVADRVRVDADSGKYDEAYIDYTIRLMSKAKSHGFRVCSWILSSPLDSED